MRVEINGKKLEIDGWFYMGYISSDRTEPDEAEEYVIDEITLLEDFDGVTNEMFQEMTDDEQLEFIGMMSEEFKNYCSNYYLEALDEYDPHRYDDIF
jgi:hypothetical protein